MVQSKKMQRSKRATPARRASGRAMRVADYAALAQFRFQIRSFLAFSEAAAAKQGLTPTQHQGLLGIKGFARPGPATVGDIARFLLIRHHSAVELINRLTKLGLVVRLADPEDARRVHLKLTETGEQKLQALSRENLEELRRAASPALSRLLKSFQRSSKAQ
ncbi:MULTISPECIES: MarR family transcriptional regulator [unclassified Bradyrhizobium]|uniref:MarR family winged helix-turn-helix transcriptional regulator n=1 Tax=unclassified Bradyrhizobium TaxID=2631580 RepID=UPI001FF907F3|nr:MULTISPECIES: MarR family transcriptional regulator [unclassified Bradyrhizobium]MCK1277675.1 MarR family transcriptional regulator [Bradyrhizobium sp. 61]MCK1445693.1 MarR family transcriptional regulator [Bradyrhizobium sp. 48]MCK1465401.1 MarR family transcriptional regulator [Bradyrhizobium sp. 2]MCK1465408.1 MarR family transcriptional regulator [Bradyrhizobium sp. 2]